ncbi:hypothetical protein XNC3_2000042 [Xenorhabdus nematophila F1]|nr:hypothetical protein XNC3_2000042 [Xenorhabdus nematophila F1]
MILRFGNKNFANLGSSFFDTPTILTSYLASLCYAYLYCDVLGAF